MFNVVSNVDLPEDIFDVSEKIVVHITKCLDKVMQYDKVSLVVLFDAGNDVRKFLKGEAFERMLYDNPEISFLTVSTRRSLTRYLNELSMDYRNMQTFTLDDFLEATITDKPKVEEVYRGVIDTINYWGDKLFGVHGSMSKTSA